MKKKYEMILSEFLIPIPWLIDFENRVGSGINNTIQYMIEENMSKPELYGPADMTYKKIIDTLFTHMKYGNILTPSIHAEMRSKVDTTLRVYADVDPIKIGEFNINIDLVRGLEDKPSNWNQPNMYIKVLIMNSECNRTVTLINAIYSIIIREVLKEALLMIVGINSNWLSGDKPKNKYLSKYDHMDTNDLEIRQIETLEAMRGFIKFNEKSFKELAESIGKSILIADEDDTKTSKKYGNRLMWSGAYLFTDVLCNPRSLTAVTRVMPILTQEFKNFMLEHYRERLMPDEIDSN